VKALAKELLELCTTLPQCVSLWKSRFGEDCRLTKNRPDHPKGKKATAHDRKGAARGNFRNVYYFSYYQNRPPPVREEL
jgi:hypothetical protein